MKFFDLNGNSYQIILTSIWNDDTEDYSYRIIWDGETYAESDNRIDIMEKFHELIQWQCLTPWVIM